MVDTLKTNPRELQNIFSDVYKKYFNSHDLILSSNAVLTWGPDISHWVSAIKIKQKVPVRTFCWINFNPSGKVVFHTVYKYSVLTDNFENDTFRSMYLDDFERIEKFIREFLVKNRYYWGLDIDFLTEAPKGHGFAFSGVISVLLAHLLYIAIWKIEGENLKDGWLPKEHPFFEEIYMFSIELSNCISEGKSIGASNYVAMLPNHPTPVVFITQKNGLSHEESSEIQKNEILSSDNLNSSNETLYRGGLTDFLGIPHMENSKISIDYGVIFMGVEYVFDDMESVRGTIEYRKDQLQEFMRRTVQALPIGVNTSQNSTIRHILNLDEAKIFQNHIDGMNMRILEGFDRMYANGFNDRAVSSFVSTIQSIGYASFSYQEQNKFFSVIQYLFHEFRRFEEEEIGMLPFNIGKLGGSFLFVMKHRNSRATLEKVLARLRDQGHPVSLDFASWRDGQAADGVRLEQFISKSLFSKYTSNSSVQFSDSNGILYCGDYKEILDTETDCILLDTIKRRIYMRGSKLTSKDIHSQNTTIDMMTLLMKHIGETVSNGKLPISTYSQNKNEILSKVILPIKRLTKEYFDKKLLLTCSGWITDYYLHLERDSSIRIGIISKIGS